MLKIGLDIDDCLCDFMNTYESRFGKQPSKIITRNCFQILRYDKDFWVNLPVKHMPDFNVTLYCTKRVNPKSWSKKFLEINNFPKAPIYQIYYQQGSKAPLIKGRVDVFVDDSISNFEDLNSKGIPCLLMDCPYNSEYETPLRIYSLSYKEIKETYERTFGKH